MSRDHVDRKALGLTSTINPKARGAVSQIGEWQSRLGIPELPVVRSWSELNHAFMDTRRDGSTLPRGENGYEFSNIRVHHERGLQGTGHALPHLDRIQTAFGPHSLSGVRVFIDTEACKRVGADAYAFGESIAFSHFPDLRTAAHEAAHVVQQRHGVMLRGGIGIPGDVYERHADAVADRVVRGERADFLITSFVGGIPAAAPHESGSAVQMGVKSFVVKKAVKGMAYAIRHGGYLLKEVIHHLDDDAARILSRYGDDIADALDDIANIPDLAVHMVKEKLLTFMVHELTIDHGAALMIANAVEATLWFLL